MVGFLSPEGIFYACEEGNYLSKAQDIYWETYNDFCCEDAENFLLLNGYLLLKNEGFFTFYQNDMKDRNNLTISQLQWLQSHLDMFVGNIKDKLTTMLYN